ncbi:MAG: serine/threonine protein kinase [Myxococcales bacterium]|nr:serine/threonine protein kinase [Myxococcales bacterium]MCB9644179.1 serine/threonine protein kinase [Myxococcales bacterium]
MANPPKRDGFEKLWQSISLSENPSSSPTIAFRTTLMPGSHLSSHSIPLDSLPLLIENEEHNPEGINFVLREPIGRGGMGEVWSASQAALSREVAIKMLPPKNRTREAVQRLLQEARVTGFLEHPNIIPVYALGRTSEDTPALVMKKVKGQAWSEMLLDEIKIPEYKDEGFDALEWHIRLLMQVCNAIHFAHSKGILHRDLKPDNIMVGEFGEVYIVDWGVAVSWHGNIEGVPSTSEINGLAGTPAYMPPEMVDWQNAKWNPTTDVYLLGAILHEIITKEAPHSGDTIAEILGKAYDSVSKDYDETVPGDLAAICRKAMKLNQAERYRSALEFRQALALFLKHRSSRQLSNNARESLGELEQLLESTNSFQDSLHDDPHVQIYSLFSECRFGFQQALREWPENPDGHKGLEKALHLMVNYEIRQRNPRAAQRLLHDLNNLQALPHDELKRLDGDINELFDKEFQRADEYNKLKQMEQDANITVGARGRSYFALLLGFTWGMSPLITRYLEKSGNSSGGLWDRVQSDIIATIVIAIIFFLMRKRLLQNAINRKISYTIMLLAFTFIFHGLAGIQSQANTHQMLILEMPLVFAVVASMAIALERRMWVFNGLYFLCMLLAISFPSWVYILLSAANLSVFSGVFWIWNHDTRAAEQTAT